MTLQVFPNENCGVPDVAVSSEPPHSDTVMKKPTYILSVQRGFSLVELLVVIAVIAIIAAIAIPNIANITGSATGSKDLRNAQSIVSTFNAARAAGFNASQTLATAIAAVASGTNTITGTGTGSGGNGMTTGMTMGGLNMSAANITAATALITSSGLTTNLTLIYTGATNN